MDNHPPDPYKTSPQARLVSEEKKGKSERITIRLNAEDLSAIREKAESTGMPYQTLISTILHKYVQGSVKIEL